MQIFRNKRAAIKWMAFTCIHTHKLATDWIYDHSHQIDTTSFFLLCSWNSLLPYFLAFFCCFFVFFFFFWFLIFINNNNYNTATATTKQTMFDEFKTQNQFKLIFTLLLLQQHNKSYNACSCDGWKCLRASERAAFNVEICASHQYIEAAVI